MSKKDFDMSQLVSGLTGEQEEKNENRTQTVKRKKPMELSEGMKVKLNLAMALSHGAKLLKRNCNSTLPKVSHAL